jgi:hypothetical protein
MRSDIRKKHASRGSVSRRLIVGREWQSRQFMPFGLVADRAGRAGAPAIAGARALPGPLGVVLANPSAIIAVQALHFRYCSSLTFSIQSTGLPFSAS